MARRCGKQADQALLLALACGATVENAARKAGISERTAYRRLDNAAFVQQLQQLRAEMVHRTAGMRIRASGVVARRLRYLAIATRQIRRSLLRSTAVNCSTRPLTLVTAARYWAIAAL